MIQFKDVSKIYRMGENSLRALDHANMHIREGEFVSIIGPSGSGPIRRTSWPGSGMRRSVLSFRTLT